MAVRKICEKSREGGTDKQGQRDNTRTFIVVCDPGDTGYTAVSGLGIHRYDPHPDDIGIVAIDAHFSHVDDVGWIFSVAVKYDSVPFDLGASGTNSLADGPDQTLPASPSQSSNETKANERPWAFAYDSVDVEKPLKYDKYRIPVVTSAWQPFTPAVSVRDRHKLIKLTAFMDGTFPALAKADYFEGSVNVVQWGRYPRWVCRCNKYVPTSVYDNGEYYWKIDIEIEINWDYWHPIWVPNLGTVEIRDGKILPILDNEGRPINVPVPLKRSTGARMTLAEIEADPGPRQSDVEVDDVTGIPLLKDGATQMYQDYYYFDEAEFQDLLTD